MHDLHSDIFLQYVLSVFNILFTESHRSRGRRLEMYIHQKINVEPAKYTRKSKGKLIFHAEIHLQCGQRREFCYYLAWDLSFEEANSSHKCFEN